MKKEKIVLQKGESIKFLDYIIKNSRNNDGLVLMKENADGYECHLGNYGTGTQENIDDCKRYAIMYFMLARPEEFATTCTHKMMQLNSGTMHEYFKLKEVCKKEGIKLPKEITEGDDMNCMIYFKGKRLAKDEQTDKIKKVMKDIMDELQECGIIIGRMKSIHSNSKHIGTDCQERIDKIKDLLTDFALVA